MENFDEFKTNVYADDKVSLLLRDLFMEVAYLDTDTIRENIRLAYADGAPEELRTINSDMADYLLNNMGIIFMGLIINEDFRDTFVEAVSIEIALEEKDSEFIKDIRESMQGKSDEHSEGGNLVINLENFNDIIFEEITTKVSESFKKIENYSDAMDSLVNEFDFKEAADIGFCASNFMYTFRAFAKDPAFSSYVKKVVESVKAELEL